MILILIRVALLLAPILAIMYWLRWRAARKTDPDALEADVKRLQKRLLGLAVLALIAILSLRLTDGDRKAPAGTVYVPPKMENGELIPGHFKDAEDPEAIEDAADAGNSEQDGQ